MRENGAALHGRLLIGGWLPANHRSSIAQPRLRSGFPASTRHELKRSPCRPPTTAVPLVVRPRRGAFARGTCPRPTRTPLTLAPRETMPSLASRREPCGNRRAGYVGGMNDPTRPRLTLIQGGRDALERQLLHLCIHGPSEAFRTAIDALKPRGRLTLVKPTDAPSSRPWTDRPGDDHAGD